MKFCKVISKLPNNGLFGIIEDSYQLNKKVFTNVKSKVDAFLGSHGVDIDLSSVFSLNNNHFKFFNVPISIKLLQG